MLKNMMNNLSANKKMENKNDNTFPCGKIGIDCEWCENKVKCLNKQFYSEKLYEAQGHKFTLEPYIEEIVKLFSEKIDSHQCYEITTLPNAGPSSDRYIEIRIEYDYPERYGVIVDEPCRYGWKQSIKTEYCKYDLFEGISKKLKERYGFSDMKLYSCTNNIPWACKEIHLYFLP